VIDLKISGVDVLKRALEAIPARMQNNILRAAVREASKPVRDEARSRAPALKTADKRRKPGTLKRAIGIRSPRIRNRQVVGGVAVRSLSPKHVMAYKAKTGQKAANNPNDAFYAPFVEFGTAKMRAQPFMRPALSSKAQAAIDAMGNKVRERVAAGDLTKK
jgi:HK97 gp10 family phage protein